MEQEILFRLSCCWKPILRNLKGNSTIKNKLEHISSLEDAGRTLWSSRSRKASSERSQATATEKEGQRRKSPHSSLDLRRLQLSHLLRAILRMSSSVDVLCDPQSQMSMSCRRTNDGHSERGKVTAVHCILYVQARLQSLVFVSGLWRSSSRFFNVYSILVAFASQF